MNKFKPFSIFFSLFLVITLVGMACATGTPPVEVSPATMAALTVEAVTNAAGTQAAQTETASVPEATPGKKTTESAAATPTVTTSAVSQQPVPVSFGGVSFTVPAGLAQSARSELTPANLTNPDVPVMAGTPAHLNFKLDGYALPMDSVIFGINIYPAELYARFDAIIVKQIDGMKNVLASGASDQASLPFLPIYNAGQVFHAQFKIIPFQSGNGYRFLSKIAQDASPVTNQSLLYIYQALSSDGQYVISLVLPVQSVILPESLDKLTTPAGGVNAPDLNDPDYGNKYKAYIDQVSQALTNQPADKFTPNLDTLDQLVGSINLNTVTGLIPGCPAILQASTKAYVSSDPPVSNRLRSAPSKTASVVGSIAPGAVVELLSGPTCADGLIFWQVKVVSTNATAYTAESDYKEQWLKPCPATGNCPP